jgi:hypothetical protein
MILDSSLHAVNGFCSAAIRNGHIFYEPLCIWNAKKEKLFFPLESGDIHQTNSRLFFDCFSWESEQPRKNTICKNPFNFHQIMAKFYAPT